MKPARDPKPGGIKSAAEAVERRRKESTNLANQRREASVRTKRLRRDPSAASLGLSRQPSTASLPGAPPEAPAPEPDAFEALPTPQDIDEQVQAAIQAMKVASPVGGKEHLEAVRSLRHLLSNFEDPPYLAVLSSGGIPALITALQPPCGDAIAIETIFEASWALTNLAVGDPQVVKAIVPAAPILIMHLEGGSGLAVAEQCAWALGNIAGDDAEYRATLVANGTIPPLTQLLIQGVKAAAAVNPPGSISGEDPIISAAGTASWALANLLRGAGATEIGAFMGTEGAAEALIDVLRVGPVRFTTEAAWVAAYVTAGPEAHLNRLVSLGIVPPLCARVVNAVDELMLAPIEDVGGEAAMTGDDENTMVGAEVKIESKEERDQIVRGVLTPLLRLLGNVAAGAGHTGVEQLLSPEAAQVLSAVVVCAESHYHGLQREAAWVLASLAGVPGRAGVEAIKAANALPALLSLLKNNPFHVRKEAGYALANICAGGGGGSGDSEAMNYLFGADVDAVRAMLSMMRSADMDAARLGLQFAEMLLRLLPNGVREVEAADGIDAIEALQFGATAPPELQAAAAALVDKYWGQDVDASME